MSTLNLEDFPITDLINWRNAASTRATGLSSETALLEKKLAKANKKRLSAVRWIRRLNTQITHKAFPVRNEVKSGDSRTI